MTEETKTDQADINDNLMNAVTGTGTPGKDRTPASRFVPSKLHKDLTQMGNMYESEGFAKRIVDVYAEEMVRKWLAVEGDPEEEIISYMGQIKAKQNILASLKWARLYGSSIVVMLIDDGRELDEPVNLAAINSVVGLRPVDLTQLSIQNTADWYNDPGDVDYGMPEIYTISPPRYISTANATSQSTYRVHESRVLRFDGEIVPQAMMSDNGGFGQSVLTPVYNYLINLSQSYATTAEIMLGIVLPVFGIKNLASLVQTDDGVAALKTRMEILAYCQSVNNGVIMDAEGETFDKMTTSVTGIPEIIVQFGLALSAVTGIPYMVLMGESPGGLTASSDNTIRAWYDAIASEQEESLGPQITKLVSYIMLSSDNPLTGKTIDDVKIKFASLWQYDEPTQVDMKNKQAQTDQIYIQNGVVMPEDITKSRFGGEIYSYETTVDKSMLADKPVVETPEPEITPTPTNETGAQFANNSAK